MSKHHARAIQQQFTISASHEEAICRLLRERTGIVIQDHQLKSLRDTLVDACQHFDCPGPDAYLDALLTADDLSPEFEFLVAGVTVGESYFFRDETQMQFLRDTFLPALVSRRRAEGKLELSIWSAGCSKGQELYSIAILLHDMLPDINDWNLQLLGTDINTSVLSSAVKGRYHEWSLRAVDAWQRQRYFRQLDKEYELDPTVRHGVKFAYLNLRDYGYPSILNNTHALDLILCRNVFIYLQQPVVKEIMARMRDSMRDQGMLMLGASDTMDVSVPGLTMHNHDYVHYFQKEPTSPEPGGVPDQKRHAVNIPANTIAEDKIRRAGRAVKKPAKKKDKPLDLQTVIELIHEEKWQDVVNITTAYQGEPDGKMLQLHAKALANLGLRQEAAEACERSLELDVTDKHSHFIYGLVLLELERTDEAEVAFNKALYLDRGFIEAYYQLGLLMIRSGRNKAGLKNLMNAVALAEQGDPGQLIHDTIGMTYDRFAQVLRSEITIYQELESGA